MLSTLFISPINQNLTELDGKKIEQKSGSLSDGTDTYTGINLDFISYDATAKKILLHEKGTGADAVIPFSSGGKWAIVGGFWYYNQSTDHIYYWDSDGNAFDGRVSAIMSQINAVAPFQIRQSGRDWYIRSKEPGYYTGAGCAGNYTPTMNYFTGYVSAENTVIAVCDGLYGNSKGSVAYGSM